jgi:hypothetical protein
MRAASRVQSVRGSPSQAKRLAERASGKNIVDLLRAAHGRGEYVEIHQQCMPADCLKISMKQWLTDVLTF